jgi:hypothetical protein
MTSNFGYGLLPGCLTFLLSALFILLAIDQLRPPEAVGMSASATEFSSERAMKHLYVIASKPHPPRSPEHAEVGNYIVNELLAMGLSPERQEGKNITNILVRLKGSGRGKALLLAGHYDTVPSSPGASDDGSAVVVILETLRAVLAGPPLDNDLICLFSDGEESGLQGAKAFVFAHPWAKDAGLVLNFEARGNSGPALMFETSDENGWLVRQFAQADPYPVGSSLSYELYKLLPNSTDLTIFKEAGFAGLNFAFINGSEVYHTANDSVHTLDQRSLQHQGSHALSLTRRFGNTSLEQVRDTDAVYFNLLGSGLIVYSQRWVLPLCALTSLLFIGVMAWGRKRRVLTFGGIAQGTAAVGLSIICVLMTMLLLWWLLETFQRLASLPGTTHYGGLQAFIIALISALAAAVCYRWSLRRLSAGELMAGGLVWWLLMSGATGLFLPGGSYLFTWPLLFNLMAVAFAFTSSRRETAATQHLVMLSLAALLTVILFAPIVYLSIIAFTLKSPLSVVVLVIPTGLILASLAPHLKQSSSQNTTSLP